MPLLPSKCCELGHRPQLLFLPLFSPLDLHLNLSRNLGVHHVNTKLTFSTNKDAISSTMLLNITYVNAFKNEKKLTLIYQIDLTLGGGDVYSLGLQIILHNHLCTRMSIWVFIRLNVWNSTNTLVECWITRRF
jgi:hypothetical protein